MPGPYPQRDSALLGLACGLDFVSFIILVVISKRHPGLRNTELGVMFAIIWYSITTSTQVAERLALAQTKICGISG